MIGWVAAGVDRLQDVLTRVVDEEQVPERICLRGQLPDEVGGDHPLTIRAHTGLIIGPASVEAGTTTPIATAGALAPSRAGSTSVNAPTNRSARF